MKKLLASLVLLSMSTAYASTYHGVVLEISIAASSDGGTQVSVLTSGATDCHAAGTMDHWYSFEYPPNRGPGTAWLAALLSAKVTQESIVIHGTGTCDASGMEEVTAIDLPSASMPISAASPAPHFPPALVSSPPSQASTSTSSVLPALALGSAPVYGLKSPYRVPGQYFVSFKTSQELAATSPEQLARSICPSLRPADPQQAQKLATCLAENVGATNVGILHIGKREVAVVKGMSDSGVSILANDPRVNSIQVVHVVKKAAVQTPSRSD